MIPPLVQERLLESMDRLALDAVVANTYGAIRNLTGGWYSHNYGDFQQGAEHQYLPWLVIERRRPDEPLYLCSSLERAEGTLAGHPVAAFAEDGAGGFVKAGAVQALAVALAKRGLDRGRIGFEVPFVPASTLAALQPTLAGADIVDAHPLLLYVRAVKTEREVELLGAAARAVENALRAVFDRAGEGVDDHALEREALRAIAAQGAVPAQRYMLLGIGPGRQRLGAGNPVGQVLADGDVLLVDLGARLDGMHGDLVRLGSVGRPSFPVEAALALGATANAEFAAYIRPGMSQREAFAEGQRIAASHAASVAPWGQPLALHHGLGWSLYEPPFDLDWHGGDPPEARGDGLDPYGALEAGMVLSIENAVLSADGSEMYCNVEDPYVLTEDGAVRLNELPPDLIVCGGNG